MPYEGSSVPDEMARAIVRCGLLARARVDRTLDGLGLTHARWRVLAELDDAPNLHSADLARRCGVRRQTMNRLVASMDQAGLVERVPAWDDGRSLVVRNTPFGSRLLRHARRGVRNVERTMARLLAREGFDDELAEEIVDGLDRLGATLWRLRSWETYVGHDLDEPPRPWWEPRRRPSQELWDPEDPAMRSSCSWTGGGPASTSPAR